MNEIRPGESSSMKTLRVTPALASRIASVSVRRIVFGIGGQWKNASSPSRCAVGSPSVTMITCRVARGCCASRRPARLNAWCMFVPYTRSQPGGGQVLGLHRPGVVAEPDQVERVVRVAPLDQRVQGERHLLRVDEVPAQRHRERQVEQQGGRGLGALLRLDELEVVGDEPDAVRPAATADAPR